MKLVILITMTILSFKLCAREPDCDEGNLRDLQKIVDKANSPNCPEPTSGAIFALCGYAGTKETAEAQTKDITFKYEKQLWKISCAEESKDLENAKEKIKTMWNKNKEKILCVSSQSEGEEVSILIHSLEENFPTFLFELASKYDINIEENINGQTIYDYLDERINYFQKLGGYEKKVSGLIDLKNDIRRVVATSKKNQESKDALAK